MANGITRSELISIDGKSCVAYVVTVQSCVLARPVEQFSKNNYNWEWLVDRYVYPTSDLADQSHSDTIWAACNY